jgi:Cys-tRNA(Pro)/Cys-tRNA(Cys) deacylase
MATSSGTPGLQELSVAGISFEVHPYEPGSGETYGEAVAAALGVDPDRLFKTLLADVDGEPVVGIVPVSARLSTKALARASGGKKARLLAPAAAERLTGYVIGGISPFGQKRRLPTLVDEMIEAFDTVFVSAGRRGLQIELAPRDLIAHLGATVADLCE